MIRTIACEHGLEFYEDIGDSDKSMSSFLEEIKTQTKGNTPQIKKIPWQLFKAMTQGGIFCLNEANLLQSEELLAFANLIENSFFIWDQKKYRIHPNFSLVFTSNNGYAGTIDYNTAVLRKASWVVEFAYEKDKGQEVKIVKSVYNKLKNTPNFQTTKEIDDEQLEMIVQVVYELREKMRDLHDKWEWFYTEDGNPFFHFFYIRLYEHIIWEMLVSDESVFYMDTLIKKLVPSLNPKISFFNGQEYIELYNDTNKFEALVDSIASVQGISVSSYMSDPIIWSVISSVRRTMWGMWGNISWGLPKLTRTKWFNPNAFRKTLENVVQSRWEKLSRKEFIEDIALSWYQQIVDSQTKKDIKILWFKDEKLELEVWWQVIKIFSESPDLQESLKKLWKSRDIEDFEKIVFSEATIQVQIWENEDIFNNIFSREKVFDVRRRSKIVEFNQNSTNYIALLGMKGNIKDVRYMDESGTYFIPQSKASDIIYTLYEVVEDIPEKWHFFTISDEWELIVQTPSTYNWWKILKKLPQKSEESRNFDNDVRKRFANTDKLNLRNGGQERVQTATPSPIYTSSEDIHSRAFDNQGRKLDYVTMSTSNIIEEIKNQDTLGWDVLLTGHSGTWKTSIAKKVADDLGRAYISLQVPEDFSESDINSQYAWNEGVIEKIIQPFLSFYINGGVVEMKELNMAFMSTFLNQYMDKNGTIEYKWYSYQRHPDFLMIATRNPIDPVLYPGTKPMNTATIQRFREIEVPYLPLDETQDLIAHIVSHNNPKLIEALHSEEVLRELVKQIFEVYVLPIREQIGWLSLSQNEDTSEELLTMTKVYLNLDKLIHIFSHSSSKEEVLWEVDTYMMRILNNPEYSGVIKVSRTLTSIKSILQ